MTKVTGLYNIRPDDRAAIWEGSIPGSHEPGFIEPPILQLPTRGDVREMVQGAGHLELFTFEMGECNILLGREPANGRALRWHLTISCPDRHPTWDEIKTAKYRLTGPDVPMVMILPPTDFYVDAHPHVFQLWQLLDGEATDAWVV